MRNHGHVRLEDFESLFEALQMGDGPEDNSEDENDDDGEYGDAVKHGDKAGVSGGSKKSVLCDSQEEEVGKEVEEEDSWADIPERVDLATCKALLAKHYPGEEVGYMYKANSRGMIGLGSCLGLELWLGFELGFWAYSGLSIWCPSVLFLACVSDVSPTARWTWRHSKHFRTRMVL